MSCLNFYIQNTPAQALLADGLVQRREQAAAARAGCSAFASNWPTSTIATAGRRRHAPSPKRGVAGEHQQLLAAALAGQADEAVALLRAHLERMARVILDDPALFKPRDD